MKRIIALVLVLVSLAGIAIADTINLSGLSFDELVALKDKINLAIWNSQEWQEVKVPQGIWKVGEDIPAGHWTISASDKSWVTITYGNKLDDSGKSVSWMSDGMITETLTGKDHVFASDDDLRFTDINMKNGYYIEISGGTVIFTPYSGKPSLGFK